MTAQEIADKLSLPSVPSYIGYVDDLPVGSELLGGIAGPLFGNAGGAFQYFIINGRAVFGNITKLHR